MTRNMERELAHLALLDIDYIDSCGQILMEFSDKKVVREMIEVNNIVELKISPN